MSLSPALLLAIVLAAACAGGYSLIARPPWALLPLCWALGLAGFIAGQVIGAVLNQPFGMIGQLYAGFGIVAAGVLLAALYLITVWYNGRQRPGDE